MPESFNSIITYPDFERIDVRTGTVMTCKVFEKARKPAYQLTIDFGPEIGVKKSSAQITVLYQPEQLIGTQVVAVVNFPPRQIADFMSEVLVLGVSDSDGHIVILRPEQPVPNGQKMH
jgi:tRNA-binding protein